jgi:hypothetical protein
MNDRSTLSNDVANPGSALGEAIGTLLENEIHRILKPIAEEKGCIYITTGPANLRTDRKTKLILTDSDGNNYNIDSVVINNRFQPLVLVESKYIRYKKHNRDKASWICTAHTKLRQRYATVRKSIAILMGNWSKPSKRLLQSFEVELFEVPFNDICGVLAQHSIDYLWTEKNRQQAMESWQKFLRISERDREQIAKELIAGIENDLQKSLEVALDESIPRKVRSVTIVVRSERGETYTYVFPNLQRAIDFMQSYDEERDMDTSNAPALLTESKKESKIRRGKKD